MSALDGVNYGKSYSSNPSDRSGNVGDYGGSVKVLLDYKTGMVAADTVNIGKLPNRARVLSVNLIGCGAGAAVNVAAMDLMSAETIVILTVGTTPGATAYVWIEYAVC